jgi:CRP/FNR family transcriptional regulator, cyclic AMP receptor protein
MERVRASHREGVKEDSEVLEARVTDGTAGPASGGRLGRERIGSHQAAPLLDLDPELGDGLSDAQRSEARHDLLVRTATLEPRGWSGDLSKREGFGFLVIDGALARRVTAGRGRSLEVLTKGDLVRPWQENHLRGGSVFFALTPSRVAILDRPVVDAMTRWPPLFDALLQRALRRVGRLGTQAAVDSRVGIEWRVLLTLVHLAERCGIRGAEGIVVPLPLSHQMLADLVGAQRQTVSAALSRLAAEGTLRRTEERGWLITDVRGVRDQPPSSRR